MSIVKNKNSDKKTKRKLKRKKYSDYLVRILIPFMVIGILAFIAFTSMALNRVAMDMPIAQNLVNDINYNIQTLNEDINTGTFAKENEFFQVDKEALYRERLRMAINIRSTVNNAALAIYDLDGKKLINNDYRAFIVVKLNNDAKYVFGCAPKQFGEEVKNMIVQDCQINSSGNNVIYHRIELKDAYVKGGEFLPGEYTLYRMKMIYGENEDQKTEVGSFKGVDKIPEGYEHVIFDEKNIKLAISPIVLGTNISPEQNLKNSKMNEIVDHGLETSLDVSMGKSDSAKCSFDLKGHGYSESASLLTLKDSTDTERKCILVANTSIDAIKIIWPYILGAWILGIAVIIVISVLIARINYKDYKDRYNMEQYRKMMTETLAHDLKSPLMAISGYAETLKAGINPDKNEYYADSVIRTTNYMNTIISSMFELETLEELSIELNKTQLNLTEMVQRVKEEFNTMCTEKNIDLSVEGEAFIIADAIYMKRLLENLIGNAVKYTPNNEKIQIVLSKKEIKIINTGIMIKPELLKTIKEPFVKGCHERSDESGTGLGLAIVNQIVKLHNMKFTILSEDNHVEAKVEF